MNSRNAWDRRTRELLEEAYVAAGDGPRGAGSRSASPRLAPASASPSMDHDGTWLDVGCANGYLMASLLIWCAERG